MQDANDSIIKGFELEALPYITLEQLRSMLRERIAYMLHYQTEELLSKLYRLDIFEEHIKAAFAAGGDIALKLADLIIQRQEQKIASKRSHPAQRPDDDELAW